MGKVLHYTKYKRLLFLDVRCYKHISFSFPREFKELIKLFLLFDPIENSTDEGAIQST